MAWTEPDDIRNRWLNGDVPATEEQLLTLIEDAEDLILGEFPEIKNDAAKWPTAKRVVSRMINRVMRNPSGIRSTNHTEGPYSANTTYAGDNPGELYLSDDDRRDLGGRRAKARAFTVSTVPRGWAR
jgi:hypothetical protein